jgi:hypothetical protein
VLRVARYLDVEGFKSETEAGPLLKSGPWRDTTADEIMSLVAQGSLAPIPDMTEARAALALVMGIDVAATACLESSRRQPGLR